MNLIFSVQTWLCCCCLPRVCKCRFLEQEFKGKLSSEPPLWGNCAQLPFTTSPRVDGGTPAQLAHVKRLRVSGFSPFRSTKISAHLSAYYTVQLHLRSHFWDANDSGFFLFCFFLNPIQIRERTWTNRRVHPSSYQTPGAQISEWPSLRPPHASVN